MQFYKISQLNHFGKLFSSPSYAEERYQFYDLVYPGVIGNLFTSSNTMRDYAFERLQPEYMLNPFFVELVSVMRDVYQEKRNLDYVTVYQAFTKGDKKQYQNRIKVARKALVTMAQLTDKATDKEVEHEVLMYFVSCGTKAGSGFDLPALIESVIGNYASFFTKKASEAYIDLQERNPQDDTIFGEYKTVLDELQDLVKIHEWQSEVRDLTKLTVTEPDEPLIYRNGVGFIRRADLHMISGQAGSMKSFFSWYLAMAAINDGKDADKTLGFYAGMKGLKVGYVDTELNDNTLNLRIRDLEKTCDGRLFDQNRFMLLTVGIYSKEQRKKRIFDFIRESDRDIIFVDSLRELCYDMNDVKETSELADTFKRLTMESGKAIVVTSHTAKGTDFSRGHMGSQFNDLVAMEISLRPNRDEQIVKVDFNKCRFRQPDSFIMKFDNNINGLIEVNLPYDKTELTRRQQTAKELFEKTMKKGVEYTYGQILNLLTGVGVNKETAKKYISSCVGVILQKDGSKYILPTLEPLLDLDPDDDLPL